jgi:hypothetical protein
LIPARKADAALPAFGGARKIEARVENVDFIGISA